MYEQKTNMRDIYHGKKEIYTNLTSANQRQMKTLEGPPADALRLLAAGG